MEFPFNCDIAMGSNKEGFACIDSAAMKKLLPNKHASQIVDIFGELSAKVKSLYSIK